MAAAKERYLFRPREGKAPFHAFAGHEGVEVEIAFDVLLELAFAHDNLQGPHVCQLALHNRNFVGRFFLQASVAAQQAELVRHRRLQDAVFGGCRCGHDLGQRALFAKDERAFSAIEVAAFERDFLVAIVFRGQQELVFAIEDVPLVVRHHVRIRRRVVGLDAARGGGDDSSAAHAEERRFERAIAIARHLDRAVELVGVDFVQGLVIDVFGKLFDVEDDLALFVCDALYVVFVVALGQLGIARGDFDLGTGDEGLRALRHINDHDAHLVAGDDGDLRVLLVAEGGAGLGIQACGVRHALHAEDSHAVDGWQHDEGSDCALHESATGNAEGVLPLVVHFCLQTEVRPGHECE